MIKYALTAALVCASVIPTTGSAQRSLIRRDTTIRSFDGREMRGQVLELSVPERHAHPARKLKIGAVRFAATTAKPGNAIVFLMGGPGIPGTAMVPIPPYFSLFDKLRGLADVIVVDQRGIGLSTPHPDCPPPAGTLPSDAFVETDHLVSWIRDEVAKCAAVGRAKGIEPTAYNTNESADDVDDLRAALGVAKIDLLAFSYGTRWALSIASRHSSHVGRIVLQGVNGPGLVVKRPVAVERKLSRINLLLKSDSAWGPATDLTGAARRTRERLSAVPASVTIADRKSGQSKEVRVSREGFDAIAALNLDDARLPALIVSVASGDDRLLTRFVEAAWNGLSSSPIAVMARSVNCAADRPRARWTLAETDSRAAPFGMPIDNAFLTARFCAALGFFGKTMESAQPVRSAAPVLLMTGALDATNPIENARDVAATFTNSTMIEIANAAHEALPVEQVQEIIVEFLSGRDVTNKKPSAEPPHFPTVSEALQSQGRRTP